MSPDLILGSASPRRASLLKQLGLRFEVCSPDIDETLGKDELPTDFVSRLSREKAAQVKKTETSADVPLLAADTIVVINDRILGKPTNRSEGIEMLETLSGSIHSVVTGVTVCHHRRLETFVVETLVKFRVLNTEEAVVYWNTGEPADKAGAYGLQGIGGMFVERIDGSYSNVVGLPLMETVNCLRRFGLKVPGPVPPQAFV